MICRKCGAELPPNTSFHFCPHCGAPLLSEQQGYWQSYAPPYYGAPTPGVTAGRGMAIASLVLGILALVSGTAGFVCGLLAVIFGGVAKSKGYRGGMATAGLICGIIPLALCLWVFLLFLVAL